MALLPWREEPLTSRPLDPFHLIDQVMRSGDFSSAVRPQTFGPSFSVEDSDDAYVIVADLPGFAKDDLDVELKGRELVIRGTHSEDDERNDAHYRMYQRRSASFVRTFAIPEAADAEGIEARLVDGVFRVTVPKHRNGQRKKVRISQRSAKSKDRKSLKERLSQWFGKKAS